MACNQQQRRVVDQLRANAAVVVQGPPGTGKTHTIANLISALLAEGLRVLVSSRNPHPLRVIHGLLPDGIRRLSVLAPGTSVEDRKDLDRTLVALTEHASVADEDVLRKEIESLRLRRANLHQQWDTATADLGEVRAEEFRTVPSSIDGYRGTPAQLIALVEQGRATHDWIVALPDNAAAAAALTGDEATELLSWLRAGYETAADDEVPDPAVLTDPRTMNRAVRAITEAHRVFGADFDEAATLMGGLSGPALREITASVDAAADALGACGLQETISSWERDDWRTRAASDLLHHRNSASWATLTAAFEQISPVLQAAASAGDRDVDWAPGLTEADYARLLRQAKRLRNYLQGNRRVRRLLPSPEQVQAAELLTSCTVAGLPPTTLAQLRTLIAALQSEGACAAALEMCQAMMIPVRTGTRRLQLAQLQDVKIGLDAVGRLATARRRIEQALQRPDSRYLVSSPARWDLIVRLVRNSSRVVVAEQFTRLLDQLLQTLTDTAASLRPGPLAQRLFTAVADRDADAYAGAYADVVRAHHEQQARIRCEELLNRLAGGCPDLAELLRLTAEDPAWDRRLPAIQPAWDWARAAAQVGQRDAALREQQYQHRLDQIEQQWLRATEDLAGKEALLRFKVRTGLPHWQALQAFGTAVARFGKTGGKYKAERLKDLRSAMRDAIPVIPALLMPTAEVANTIPAEADAFDVVIVDEASQVTVDGAFMLWLAPRAVIVGDHKQCTPGHPPETLPVYWRMAREYLPEVPDHLRRGFGPDSNLYELMSTQLMGLVRLEEHFRCMPEIIGWSSHEFYEGRLQPLRQFGADRLDPFVVVPVHEPIVDGLSTTLQNHTEAAKIVDEIRKMADDPRYRTKSIGVIVMYASRSHLTLVNRLVEDGIDKPTRDRHRIRVGDPAAFQGDERDVILLSMVVAKPPGPAAARQDRERFNVAASRARDQLWMFLSLPDDQLSLADLRHSLLTYMRNPPNPLTPDPRLDAAPTDRLVPPFGSLLEQQVYLELRRRDFAVVAQYPMHGTPIDLLVVGDNGLLAVECHSPSLPMTADEISRDLERERQLLRCGWEIIRIRESDYLRDPQTALDPLWARLRARGIGPTSLRPAPAGRAETWSPVSASDLDDEGEI
ncbi:AAA domain-containing protein [Actinoplanes sp. NPDC051851]|uniref:AAA domain-containing protein n=1 Tax=Actinoplanes sp. NPDC051851 TaxID=3154753 RepID=UPI00341ACE7C